MRANRRAARATMQVRTVAMVGAIVAVLALIPILIAIQSGNSQASEDPVSAAGSQSQSQQHGNHGASDAGSGRSQNSRGVETVTEVDKTFLVKVRQAGLWEIPAGRLAQDRAASEAVKRAGLHLLDGHSELDQLVREDAHLLGVQIPDEATAEQQDWVKQLESVKGDEFDRLFANILRSSHGKIFATIAEVRASTQNDLIRRHARQANQTVLDHLEVLEDTGLVTPETLEEVEADVTPK
jgi:predicted outer membrane protein